ncbi:MAG: SUMF1/EgtB/PvdO family nonheme iron enzyme, partial [Myxococcales bacterium]|nr:SUMF1/EgtB/PvdO family nonheme iron enzyme [Myxococcales bacterium]
MSSFERRDERRGRIGALFEVIVIEFRIAWIGPLLLAALGALAGGCGGSDAPRCEATFTAWAGAACGPCALDTLRCVDGALVCDGATDCSYGDACTDSDACDQGICTEGRCAPEGMAFIPGGTFLMGSPPFELGRIDSEPEHPVRLSRHYFMDRTETTQADFERLMGFQPSHFTACGPDCPAENMLWLEALSYANARSAAEGLPPCYDLTACRGAPGTGYFQCDPPIAVDLDCRGYRLPTEAEWEHAYRAETRTAYYNGSTESFDTCQQPLLEEIARFCGNCSASYGQPYDCSMGGARPDQPTDCGPGPVGGYAPNPWGLYDMSGNIAEMVWDAHGPYERYAIDPIGPPQDGYAMLRGAGFCGHMARLRASDRKFTTWTAAHPSRGFRLVRSYREAAAGETVGDDVCDNGCGGCGPLPASPGTPCGPCGADRYVCTSEESTECSGNTTGCEFGSPCAADAECVGGHCSNGHCAPGGFEYIPSGLFQMGSPGSEPLRDVDELYHDVGLRRPYLMQSHEVTREQWHSLIGVHRGSFEACGTDCPIETVNRWDAMIYANTQSRIWGLPECYDLSACDGEPGSTLVCPVGIGFDVACEGFRLPTEAEWERAYRAGTETIFYNGTTSPAARCDQPLLLEIAHFCGNCDAPYPRGIDCSATGGFANCGPGPVGRFAPNAWG